ncbi:MAG: YhdP family protein [Halioglobus sp.]
MEHAFFYRLSSILWKAIVGMVVVLAIYVSFGRLLMSNVESFGDEILRELNFRSPFQIEANDVSGEWHSFTPEIVLTELRLTVPGSNGLPLELAEGRVAIDVWESLRTRSLQTFRVNLDRLLLRGELTEDGKLLIAGMGGGGGDFPQLMETFLLNIEQVNLTNNQLFLDLPNQSQRLFDLDLVLRREGSFRRVEANLGSRTTGTGILIVAEGVGNPMVSEKFSGDLYIDVVNADLESLQRILPKNLSMKLAGEVGLQAWLDWDRGVPKLQAEITGAGVSVEKADGSWKIPLEKLFVEASLMKRDDRWTVFASGLELQTGSYSLNLPRLQFDVRGDSLRVRSGSLQLGQVSAFILGLELLSDKPEEVFRVLDPRGEITALELNVADFNEPAQDWEVTGNFEALEVQPWHGAPGVTAASGYLEFEAGGGFVQLDSHQFSMFFPTIYREPIRFDDFYGKLFIDWTATDVTLSSSLVHAEGIAGRATALFGLNIPLVKSEVGLEMDLLVGLTDSHPIHRTKYLPYTLNDALLGWLKGSIGEGRIEEGAFLWRGSLLKAASAARTVQLFFNVADTNLDYYPGWPSLSGLEGIVLINDTQVSVWSEKARLYDSAIEFLSVEAWLNEDKQMMLAIDSQMKGDAGDGIKVINTSPLGSIVGEAFTEWSLSGELDTQLDLLMNLTNPKVPPRVTVDTDWSDVDLQINPGALRLDDINGQLSYSSALGFSSTGLSGSIWGKALEAEVRQAAPVVSEGIPVTGSRYNAASSITELEIKTDVDIQDIRQWLNLELLALAEGVTAAELLIEVPPGLSPRLSISSDLTGVSLDLPDPWRKAASEQRPLLVSLPLVSEPKIVSLDLDDELFLQVRLADNRFDGVALGVQQVPYNVTSGVVKVSGHASLINEEQWQTFLSDYVYSSFPDQAGVQSDPDQSLESQLEIHIEDLQADKLQVFGQTLNDVVFSIEMKAGDTRLSAEAGWLAGELLLSDDNSSGQLLIERLDLDGLSHLSLESGEGSSFEIPDLDVSLKNISRDGLALGELAFLVRHDEQLLRVEQIEGNLAGLELTSSMPNTLLWSQGGEASKTQLRALLEFRDFGKTLEKLTYQNIIETRSGQIDVALEWPGGPQDFSLADLQGSLALDVDEGRFLDTPSGASGTLKVVGILNLADIVQRLSLDLSDMFSSGIPFHSIQGDVLFQSGTIEVPNMDVKGRSSGFQFSGESDVVSQSLEGELIATLPVANNLPWVAALAVGLPVAAGVFVVSKVFEKQMNRFSSAVYRIDGTWGNPEIDFDRIFDTSSARKVIVVNETETRSEETVLILDPNNPMDSLIQDPNSLAPGITVQPLPAAATEH